MQKNKRGRPKQILQTKKKNDGKTQSESDCRSTTPQYDKIMLQIKETYANLKEPEKKLVKIPRQRGRPPKKQQKLRKLNIDDLVKLEPQEPLEAVERYKSQIHDVMKRFLEDVASDYKKAEQELIKIQIHK